MSRISELEAKVKDLYGGHKVNRDIWVDRMWDSHVLVVANYASELAKKYNADPDLSRAAALLHDIADIKMGRKNKNHETESLKIAKQLLREFDYSLGEIKIVVYDAIRYHSCHGNDRPKTLEGKILATADALGHFKTDFYVYFAFISDRLGMDLEGIKNWTLEKIDRDLNAKIAFEDERKAARKDYDILKDLFSR